MQRDLYVLRRWWWLLLIAVFLGGVVAYGATKVFVGQKYQTSAIISVAPAPQGPNGLYVTSLSATADSALISTLSTAQAARNLLPPVDRRSVNADKLAHAAVGSASIDGELIYVSVTWPHRAFAPILANAMARAYIRQERMRLSQHYRIIHAGLATEKRSLATLERSTRTSGQAGSFLASQYSLNALRLSQDDVDAKIQTNLQLASLQVAQPATDLEVIRIGAKASINALLGAVLGLLVALVFALVTTRSYPGAGDAQPLRPVLTSRAE
ncbi:MAG: hypothetical protein ACR2JC_02370 [Chloroflexota bacterium]